jgi:hypothetical protein
MDKANFKLKASIIEAFGNQVTAAREFKIREDRLSRIIHARVSPTQEEKRTISWKLQKRIADLFPK